MIEYRVKVRNYKHEVLERWYLDEVLHCEHGPALKHWYKNNPKYSDNKYYLNGIKLTKEEWKQKLRPTKEMTIEEIQKELGYKIKIVE